MAASTFGRSQVGSTFANIGFAFETSGFQVDPLFFKVMEGEGTLSIIARGYHSTSENEPPQMDVA